MYVQSNALASVAVIDGRVNALLNHAGWQAFKLGFASAPSYDREVKKFIQWHCEKTSGPGLMYSLYDYIMYLHEGDPPKYCSGTLRGYVAMFKKFFIHTCVTQDFNSSAHLDNVYVLLNDKFDTWSKTETITKAFSMENDNLANYIIHVDDDPDTFLRKVYIVVAKGFAARSCESRVIKEKDVTYIAATNSCEEMFIVDYERKKELEQESWLKIVDALLPGI